MQFIWKMCIICKKGIEYLAKCIAVVHVMAFICKIFFLWNKLIPTETILTYIVREFRNKSGSLSRQKMLLKGYYEN